MQRIKTTLTAIVLSAASVACQTNDGASAPPIETTEMIRPQYLEIVTPEVDATCSSIEKSHGVTFSDAQADLGGARTADIAGGGMIGVRAPMHAAENSVVRPYLLVDDIESAVANAVEAGAQVAMPPTPMEGRGTFAIYFLGGIEHGLWQL